MNSALDDKSNNSEKPNFWDTELVYGNALDGRFDFSVETVSAVEELFNDVVFLKENLLGKMVKTTLWQEIFKPSVFMPRLQEEEERLLYKDLLSLNEGDKLERIRNLEGREEVLKKVLGEITQGEILEQERVANIHYQLSAKFKIALKIADRIMLSLKPAVRTEDFNLADYLLDFDLNRATMIRKNRVLSLIWRYLRKFNDKVPGSISVI